MALTTVPVELANLDGAVTVNESSADVDFRVESNGNANMLFVDGGNDVVSVGYGASIAMAGERHELEVFDTNFSVISGATFRNGSDGANLTLAHSRSGTIGTQTVLQDGDTMGGINFMGSDGTDMASYGGRIFCEVDGTPGSNDMPGRLIFATTADGATGSTERMRIASNGTVSIGRTEGAAASDHGIDLYSSGHLYIFVSSSGDSDAVRVYNSSGTQTAAIDADGDYMDLSDERYKENIVDAPSVLDTISKIKVRSFNWKEDGRKKTYGFIAQELNEVASETVRSAKDEEDVWAVKHARIVPMLTKAIQEQQTLIETLQTKVKALEEA